MNKAENNSAASSTAASEREIAREAAAACEEHHGQQIILYDLKQSSLLADYYLICSGASEPHLKALAGHIEKAMLRHQRHPRHVDGSAASRWIVIDYGYLMIHLFLPGLRQYYELEKLWEETSEIIYSSGEAGRESEPVPIF